MRLSTHSKKSVLLLCLLAVLSSVNSLFALKIPALRGRVNDYANIISSSDKSQIESMLEDLENKTGAQVAILTIQSLEDEPLEYYALKVAEKWKLGQEKEDNGVLLLVAMKERAIRIEVGYGLEELLTDAKCGLIIRNVIVPEFKDSNYSDGVKAAIQNICGLITQDDELVNTSVLEGQAEEDDDDFIYIIIAIIIIIIWFLLSLPGSRKRGGFFSSGGLFSGGGGGFSGGGGSFGGGGASGHW